MEVPSKVLYENIISEDKNTSGSTVHVHVRKYHTVLHSENIFVLRCSSESTDVRVHVPSKVITRCTVSTTYFRKNTIAIYYQSPPRNYFRISVRRYEYVAIVLGLPLQ